MSQSYGTVDDKRPTESGRKVIWLTTSQPASTTTAASGGVVGHRIGLTPTLPLPTQANPIQLTTTARISQPSICPGVGVLTNLSSIQPFTFSDISSAFNPWPSSLLDVNYETRHLKFLI